MAKLLVKTSGLKPSVNGGVKTLVMLHGWGMNSHVWEPIREALVSNYHIVWVDLPGHGFNRQCEVRSLDNMVSQLAEIIPDNAHIIGWSLGGMIAQALAQRIPKKIKSLSLVTSTPRFSQSQQGDWPHAMTHEVLTRFATNLKQDTEKTLKGFIALQFIDVKDSKQAQADLIEHILQNKKSPKNRGGVFDKLNRTVFIDDDLEETTNIPTQEALDLGLFILKHADLRSEHAICPEHWIFAEYDRLIPKEVINDLISLRPNAEITLLEKSGHAPFITHPQAFLAKLTAFIDNIN